MDANQFLIVDSRIQLAHSIQSEFCHSTTTVKRLHIFLFHFMAHCLSTCSLIGVCQKINEKRVESPKTWKSAVMQINCVTLGGIKLPFLPSTLLVFRTRGRIRALHLIVRILEARNDQWIWLVVTLEEE